MQTFTLYMYNIADQDIYCVSLNVNELINVLMSNKHHYFVIFIK